MLDIINNFSKACEKEISYRVAPRRAGDIDVCYADPEKAKTELGWEAEFGIEKMCEDTWRWQKNNPNGYNK